MDYSWGDRNDLFVRNFSYVFQVRARELFCARLRGKRIARAVVAWSAVTRIRGDPSHDTLRPLPPPPLQVCGNTVSSTAATACAPTILGTTPAVQIDWSNYVPNVNSASCYLLGQDVGPSPGGQNRYVSWLPADVNFPARGVALTYSGGQATGCANPAGRSFTLNMWCAPFPFPSAAPLPSPVPGTPPSFKCVGGEREGSELVAAAGVQRARISTGRRLRRLPETGPAFRPHTARRGQPSRSHPGALHTHLHPSPAHPRSGYWIDEQNQCAYVANVYSTLGCPLECPTPGGQLCSGNGVCGFDSTVQAARCFCNDDWIESDCSAPRYPTPTGAIAGSTIAGMLIGIGAAIGGIVFMKRRAGAAAANAVDGFYGQVQ